jgi:hypothetical protein
MHINRRNKGCSGSLTAALTRSRPRHHYRSAFRADRSALSAPATPGSVATDESAAASCSSVGGDRGADRPTVVRVVQRAAHRHVGDVVDLGRLALTARVAELTPMIVTLKDLLANHAPVAVVPERAVFTLAHRSLSKHFGQGGIGSERLLETGAQ